MGETFKKLWTIAKEGIILHKKLFALGYLFVFIASGCAIAVPLVLGKMIDEAIYPKNLDNLYFYTSIIFVIILVYMTAQSLREHFLVEASERTFYDLRIKLIETIMNKKMDFFSKYEHGDIYTRLSNNMDTVSWNFFRNLINYTGEVVVILTVLTAMLIWNWRLGLSVLVNFVICIAIVSKMGAVISKATEKTQKSLSGLNDVTLDLLNGRRDIGLFQQTKKVTELFKSVAGEFVNHNIKSIALSRFTVALNEGMGQIFILMPYIVGGYLICTGSPGITIGTIAAFYSWVTYVTLMFLLMLGGLVEIVRIGPIIDRIKEIKDYPEQEKVSMQNIEDTPDSSCIEFKEVSYGYGKKLNVLDGFNLTIRPGEKIAIVGPSGAGKSTLLDLLLRQIAPKKGEVLFGGKSIQSYPIWFYLQHFAYMDQNPHLFKLSIKDNISLGWYNIPFDRIVEAAKLVKIHDDIETLPNKYDTVLGMSGENLSGGQKQRIILARALVREPEILVLDEFTSALDKANEDTILKDILETFKTQTIICVTHSVSVANKFDNVVTLEKS